MGHLYDVRDKAIKHKAAKGDTLADLATRFRGKDDVPEDLDWKEIAIYNWATVEPAAVTRALCERIGCSDPEAVRLAASPDSLVLDPTFGPSTAELIYIPKLWKATALAIDTHHKIEAKRQTPATSIGINSLDKWFIPGHENCEADYRTEGETAYADAVQFEVYGSGYGKLAEWNDGLPTFTDLPGVPVYSAEAAGNQVRGWKGLSKCEDGALSPDGHSLNVAFSPYTAMFRHTKKGAHSKARIDLDSFWVHFGADKKPVVDTCEVKWKIHEAELTHGLLQIFAEDGKVIFARGLDRDDLAKGSFAWDGKDAKGVLVVSDSMPYRPQIQAHTDIDIEDGIALAAMHTEVRLYVHESTLPEKVPDYEAAKDFTSIDFSIPDVYHKDVDPPDTDSLWTKYMLAKSGFHPGPVNDALENKHFKIARHDFQRSVPACGGSGGGPYVRMAQGPDSTGTRDALRNLQGRRTRPWFGKPAEPNQGIGLNWRPANWTDTTADDFLARLRDHSKRMIIWVDDRNWYTDGDYWEDGFYDGTTVVSRSILNRIHGDPVALGGDTAAGRGSFEHRDDRADYDQRDVARPWIPLQVDFRLLSRTQGLKAEVDIPNEDLAVHIRKAIGPLRVDWTFDEIEKTEVAGGVTNNNVGVGSLPKLDWECDKLFSLLYHPQAVRATHPRPAAARTRMALRWALNALKAEYDRKDVTRRATYYNAPEANYGIRPADLASYFKKAFGTEAESLLPWTAKPDDARESICTAVHDAVGQKAEDVFAKRRGRAGIYLHPSRMAGDGYQVRGQVRFDQTGPYVSPNAKALEARYPDRLPQAQSVEFRLWRKTTIRGYVHWSPENDWQVPAASSFRHAAQTGPSNWRAHYTACHVCIENELGLPNDSVVHSVAALFPVVANYQQQVVSTLDPLDQRALQANLNWIQRSPNYVWPWAHREDCGVAPVFEDDLDQAHSDLYKQLACEHVSIAILMSLEMVKAIERQTGLMRGHVLVQYRTSASCFLRQYVCSVCPETPIYVQNSNLTPMSGAACPTGCGGVLSPRTIHVATYRCQGPGQHQFTYAEPNAIGTSRNGQRCGRCIYPLQQRRIFTDTRERSYDFNRGIRATPGVPSPSCGFPVGVFWNVTGCVTLWAHELGHNRHYEHAADAQQIPVYSARPEHDNAPNPLFAGTLEKDQNKGWDRACLMSYITQVRDSKGRISYDSDRDLAVFCYKCALRNRGWRMAGVPLPASDLQDLVGV